MNQSVNLLMRTEHAMRMALVYVVLDGLEMSVTNQCVCLLMRWEHVLKMANALAVLDGLEMSVKHQTALMDTSTKATSVNAVMDGWAESVTHHSV
jgi:hypothetical protein